MKNNGNTGDENADGPDARDDAALWNLLGRAPEPKVSPYFARRVLREVGVHEEANPSVRGVRWWQPAALWHAFRRLPRVAFVTGAPVAALLVLFLGLHMSPTSRVVLPHPEPLTMTTPSTDSMNPSTENPGEGLANAQGTNVTAAMLPDDVSAQDVEVIADLDNLLKREESRLWTEDDTARF